MELDDDEYESTREFHENKRRKAMEEIDITELLQRVKEGKAPKEIEIGSIFYRLVEGYANFSMEYWYEDDEENRWKIEEYSLYTKIKILDKSVIEELDDVSNYDLQLVSQRIKAIKENRNKIQEIIKHINKEGK